MTCFLWSWDRTLLSSCLPCKVEVGSGVSCRLNIMGTHPDEAPTFKIHMALPATAEGTMLACAHGFSLCTPWNPDSVWGSTKMKFMQTVKGRWVWKPDFQIVVYSLQGAAEQRGCKLGLSIGSSYPVCGWGGHHHPCASLHRHKGFCSVPRRILKITVLLASVAGASCLSTLGFWITMSCSLIVELMGVTIIGQPCPLLSSEQKLDQAGKGSRVEGTRWVPCEETGRTLGARKSSVQILVLPLTGHMAPIFSFVKWE